MLEVIFMSKKKKKKLMIPPVAMPTALMNEATGMLPAMMPILGTEMVEDLATETEADGAP